MNWIKSRFCDYWYSFSAERIIPGPTHLRPVDLGLKPTERTLLNY